VARELAAAGHEVAGLTRMAEKSSYLEKSGIRAVVGDLSDADSYRAAAESADAIVHTAKEHSDAAAEVDRIAVETLLRAAAGRPATLVYTSGCYVLGETGDEPVGEDASTESAPDLVAWRPPHERRVLEAASTDLRTAVVRPGMVYGGKEGNFATFFATAERDGAAEFVGDGANHWSPVYRGDVARLYRMIVEEGGEGIFHCAEPAALVGELAMAASRAAGAGGATRRRRLEEAREEMGAGADALTMNQVMGCPRARAFGWEPAHPPFLESAASVYHEWKR
jgi:nucleoside-diphosphate-sugar epimerase